MLVPLYHNIRTCRYTPDTINFIFVASRAPGVTACLVHRKIPTEVLFTFVVAVGSLFDHSNVFYPNFSASQYLSLAFTSLPTIRDRFIRMLKFLTVCTYHVDEKGVQVRQ